VGEVEADTDDAASADRAAQPQSAPAPAELADAANMTGTAQSALPAPASVMPPHSKDAPTQPRQTELDTAGPQPVLASSSNVNPNASAGADADPWAAILQAGAALLQGLAQARGAPGGQGTPQPPIQIERDPITGQPSVRLPLPDSAVLQQLAKAFAPWLH